MASRKVLLLSSENPPDAAVAALATALGGTLSGPDAGSLRAAVEGADLVVAADLGVAGMAARAKQLMVVCPPDVPLEAMDALKGTAAVRVVTQSPLHHLYALERLKLPAARLEMVPPGVDHRFFAPTDKPRENDAVTVVFFPGLDGEVLGRSGLGRDARLEVLCTSAERRLLPPLPAGVTVREADAEGRREALRRAAAVVVPVGSMESGAGSRALLEAMACAAPVVATRTFGLEHLMVPEQEGLLVPVGDAGAMRAAVRRLLAEPETGAELGRRARAKVVTALTAAHWVARLTRLCSVPASSEAPEFFLIAAHGRADEAAPRP